MCWLRSWGHSRERSIQETSWRRLTLLFDPERPHQSCVWCPSINLFQFAVVDTQLARPRRSDGHSLVSLTRTSREGSSANPLPCRLLSAQLQCRGVRLTTLSDLGTQSLSNTVVLLIVAHQSRVTHQEDGSHDYGCEEDGPILPPWNTCSTFALRGPKATDVVTEAVLKRSQDPDTEVSRDLSLFFFYCFSAVWPSSFNCGRVFRMLTIDDFFSTDDFSDDWYRWHAIRRTFSSWCR